MSTEQDQAALAEAWSGTITPYDQITDSIVFDAGQFDFVVAKLEPKLDKNGLYVIAIETPITNPPGVKQPYKRTLYVGTHKDKLAKLPDTRLNSPGLRFLKAVAKVNNVPTNSQSDAQLCASIVGKGFGCRIEETEYEVAGVKKKGSDFGRNVTPVGAIPAKFDKTPLAGGAAGATAAAPAAALAE